MCGESWHDMKDSLTHRPSSQGWAPGVLPTFFVQVFCLSPVCTWMEGWGEEGGYLLLCFFSIIHIAYPKQARPMRVLRTQAKGQGPAHKVVL